MGTYPADSLCGLVALPGKDHDRKYAQDAIVRSSHALEFVWLPRFHRTLDGEKASDIEQPREDGVPPVAQRRSLIPHKVIGLP